MLRVVAHKSAAAARQYYAEGLKREDYYTEKQEVVGNWHGKAAERMGLSGNVTSEAFAALVETGIRWMAGGLRHIPSRTESSATTSTFMRQKVSPFCMR